jgi:hypothetical protein
MLKPPNKESLRVTDHAVLRYLERAMEFEIEKVREHIACIRADGLRYEIRNNTVITITPDDGNLSKTNKRLNQEAINRRRQT